jgi:hypothetical protein
MTANNPCQPELVNPSRRAFFGMFGKTAALAVTAALLPLPVHRAFCFLNGLWQPDVDIEAAEFTHAAQVQAVALQLERVRMKIPTLFEREDVFYRLIERDSLAHSRNNFIGMPLLLKGRA